MYNSYKDCYREPEGYYLDSGFYKSCYETCKKCSNNGDMKNHYCIECKDNYPHELNINSHKNCYNNISTLLNEIIKNIQDTLLIILILLLLIMEMIIFLKEIK